MVRSQQHQPPQALGKLERHGPVDRDRRGGPRALVPLDHEAHLLPRVLVIHVQFQHLEAAGGQAVGVDPAVGVRVGHDGGELVLQQPLGASVPVGGLRGEGGEGRIVVVVVGGGGRIFRGSAHDGAGGRRCGIRRRGRHGGIIGPRGSPRGIRRRGQTRSRRRVVSSVIVVRLQHRAQPSRQDIVVVVLVPTTPPSIDFGLERHPAHQPARLGGGALVRPRPREVFLGEGGILGIQQCLVSFGYRFGPSAAAAAAAAR
mmetsp:Transcript_27806/g.66996  ORF Transcript_27806/g.66996 Transcript_27806/m.66996 type:complete len:258 (-) Transcript_27806:819-1592(-)